MHPMDNRKLLMFGFIACILAALAYTFRVRRPAVCDSGRRRHEATAPAPEARHRAATPEARRAAIPRACNAS